MTWAIAIGMLSAAVTYRLAGRYGWSRFAARYPHGIVTHYLGWKWSVAIVAALWFAWHFFGRPATVPAVLTPESLAVDIRSGQPLPRRVGPQVKLERVEVSGNSVILAHIVGVADYRELPAIMHDIGQWDSSGLCESRMLTRTGDAGIELVARFRTRDGASYRALVLTPAVCAD